MHRNPRYLAKRPSPWLGLLLFLVSALPAVAVNPCAACHPRETEGYSHSAMPHSLRRPADEPVGSFVHSASRTTFTVHSGKDGLWQRMERDGYVSDYHVEYVVGSGNH